MAHTAKPYAIVPTLFERVQDELSAIEQITRALGSLPDHETRVRVIGWISERFAEGFPQHATTATDDTAAHRPVDSGLSFPDDLFESDVVGTVEPADLRGVFDPPVEMPHASATEPPHRTAAERPQTVAPDKPPRLTVVKHETAVPVKPQPAAVIDERHAAGAQPQAVTFEQPHHVFERLAPAEAPLSAAPADEAADHVAPPVDRRQLTQLLLADTTPPAALTASGSPNAENARGESPARKANARASSPRKARKTKPPAPQPTAVDATKPVEHHVAPPAPQPAATPPADDSMEALLRSLVADFRELAEEWGNT